MSTVLDKDLGFKPECKMFNEFIFFLATAIEENRKKNLGILGFSLVAVSGSTSTSAAVIQRIVCHGMLNFWSLFLYRGMIPMLLTGILVIWKRESFWGPKETR